MNDNNNKRYIIDSNSFNNDDNSNNQNEIEYLETKNNKLQNQIIELNNNSYNKVFNNIYIRRIIFNHLNKFNILYPVKIRFESVKEFQEFKYKEYLHKVTLDFKDDQFELNQLPINIKHITIRKPKKINNEDYEIIQVPDHIESVRYIGSVRENYINSLSKQPHSSKIKNLFIEIYCLEILPNQIPPSVTDLVITTNRLSNNVLPSNLKKLSIFDLKSFEDNCLQIESLTHICILYSTSLILHQLSTPFFKNLVKLEYIDQDAIIDSNIQFPNNLKELIIECESFNFISQIETNQICPIQFPLSLEILSIVIYGDDNVHFELLPPNLKSLEFPFSSIVDDKGQSILPNKLEKLVICGSFNQELQVNQLPSTLTHLDFGNKFDQIIDVNVFPANLDTLIMGYEYSQLINPLILPQQLKLYQIKNPNYSYPINLTPSTHPNVAIECHDINLYYQATSSDYNQIRVLRLPDKFDSPLSTLQLQNKSNLEYLHLGYNFNHPIELSDLPIQNNIKTLQLGSYFNQKINLEHFQNLETLILQKYSNPTIITTTTTIVDDQQQQQHVHYNNYKLKNIIVSQNNFEFLKQLDINFYQFIKYSNK